MGSKSSIEWTDASWTPIRARNLETGKVGWHCTHATPGCEHCYSESLNKRLGTGLPFKPGHAKDITVFLDAKMLTDPLRWKKPRMVFVCSMTDLFGEFVSQDWIDQMFAVMALAKHHTFQILTKRASRMMDYLNDPETEARINRAMDDIAPAHWHDREIETWPLANVWAGVSAEDQTRWDERVPLLNRTNAARRFVSVEPQIGRIDTCEVFGIWWNQTDNRWVSVDNRVRPDLIIVGGESGAGARQFRYSWARTIISTCAGAGVACFVKQVGAKPFDDLAEELPFTPVSLVDRKGGDMEEWPPQLRIRELVI